MKPLTEPFRYITLTNGKPAVHATGSMLYAELPRPNAPLKKMEGNEIVALDAQGKEHVIAWMVFTQDAQTAQKGDV